MGEIELDEIGGTEEEARGGGEGRGEKGDIGNTTN